MVINAIISILFFPILCLFLLVFIFRWISAVTMSATNEQCWQFSFNFVLLANKLNSFSLDINGFVFFFCLFFFYMFVAVAVFSEELYATPSRLRTSNSFLIETKFCIHERQTNKLFADIFFSPVLFSQKICWRKKTQHYLR